MNESLLTQGLLSGFAASTERFPDRPALALDGTTLSYTELGEIAARIGATIEQRCPPEQRFVGLLAHRSLSAYAGLLGILAAGRAYVPLHPKFPLKRTVAMRRLSGVDVIVAGPEAVDALAGLLSEIHEPLTVIVPELRDAPSWSVNYPQHAFVTGRELVGCDRPLDPQPVEAADPAYLLFTSGSTGEPKGVPVSHANVQAYLRYVVDQYEVSEDDRFSQTFDLTFDLSVHDMFVSWERGACLYCIPDRALTAPARFVRDNQLTMWFSVPSAAGRMISLRMLPAGVFPDLRFSLFCGEPLPAEYASAWQQAAPRSVVENLYGPTEATIAITRYRWNDDRSPAECVNGTTPIGTPFDGQQVRIIAEDGRTVRRGADGELCLGGSQVTSGYLNDPAKTSEQFVKLLPDAGGLTWYRTGDVVREDAAGCLHYLGRLDHQVKIRGFRVELQEIEHAMRQASGGALSVAVPWPVRHGSAESIVAFVEATSELDEKELLTRCREVLPDYMVPRHVYKLDSLPLNSNGKIDRGKLQQQIEGETNGRV